MVCGLAMTPSCHIEAQQWRRTRHSKARSNAIAVIARSEATWRSMQA
jgi:hypothetical protein